ncbi:transposase [Phycicoccus sp. MAQZ13P-2]|uniref:transposase n=1 Tax=Phycicoccus mangrovi TaxID=2840470 RepID=UPI001C0008D7|nr:transposase [Phycicoccus mangrovi]MBT9256987.1 transposase [Phycicoccus mangrovi]MBT9274865.1 transposase [Phycicoccus mangrovi]
MSIEDVADELYGLLPEEFTAARNAAAAEARSSGDADLAARLRTLRKPTAGAWVLNRLVRDDPEQVHGVLELGARLRAAQGTLAAAELRALDAQRRELTRAVARQAVDAVRGAGKPVSAAVAGAVEETLRSAMVDAGVGAALATGRMVDTVSASGLEPVDLSRVVALGADAPPTRRAASADREARDEAALVAARTAAAQAEGALEQAREAAEDARRRATSAARRREEVAARLAQARAAVAALEDELAASTEAEHDARRAQLANTRDERTAHDAATAARRTLDRLTGTT